MHKYSFLDHNWLALLLHNRCVAAHAAKISGEIYDLGCGTRPYEADFEPSAARYVGIDWGNTVHELRADVVADLNGPLPIAAETADSVVSFQVLEHLREPGVMLGEAFRILKPRGLLFLTVPFQWWVHEEPHDYYRYTPYGLQYLVGKAGFVDIVVKDFGGFWPMWVLKLNYQTARLIRGPRPVQYLATAALFPLWFFGQATALVLDRFWPAANDALGYAVLAKKP